MKIEAPLVKGRLLRRYKRFLVDVELDDGSVVTAHTGNPGAMTGLLRAGSRIWLTYHDDPQRKLAYSWDIARQGRVLVGINTSWPNRLVAEAIQAGTIAELQGYQSLRREVAYGSRGSRVDMLLEQPEQPELASRCYVEVKNVTLVEQGRALFPDAPTERGRKHLRELMDMVAAGERAALVFLVQRSDADTVAPADAIDAEYGQLLRQAAGSGVEVLAYRAAIEPSRARIRVTTRLGVAL